MVFLDLLTIEVVVKFDKCLCRCKTRFYAEMMFILVSMSIL